MEVRDPIHGAIRLSPAEVAVVDHPFVQRLRMIRATGFSYLPFPGAMHSRYSHSLGVMHLAGAAFDQAYAGWTFANPAARVRFREVVRLGALCHDLGHAPFSHCTEFAMPPLHELGMRFYGPIDAGRQATHEDYTIAILERSTLAETIAAHFGFTSRHVAALVSHEVRVEDDFFLDGGVDHRRALSQLISSELDVDRMDYLVRDSYFTGAKYGQIDAPWLISSLSTVAIDGHAAIALDSAATYAFDDFLIARHHMFLMVYFHHKSVIFEELLKRHVQDPGCPWRLPADLDAYLWVDDVWLEGKLREAKDPWARRIVERRPFRRVLERHGTPEEVDLSAEHQQLLDAGIDVIGSGSTGKLSRYNVIGQKREKAPMIYVIERLPGQPVERVRPLSEATQVFERYAAARRIARLYAPPEDVGRAREILGLKHD